MKTNPLLVAFFAVCVTAVVAMCAVAVLDMTQPEQPQEEHYALTIDTSNAATMHRYGMPTKSDVMAYHMYGYWGYKQGDEMRIFAELPGSVRAWDAVYEIGYNKAFNY